MKLIKKILFVALILFVLFLLITLRKFIILSKLEKVSRETIKTTNYIVNSYSFQNNGVSISKSYNKDENYLTIIQPDIELDSEEVRKLTIYKKNEERIGILESEETKVAILDNNVIGGKIYINAFNIFDYESGKVNIGAKLLVSVISRIKTEECNNKECFLVEMQDGWKMWVEKETGLIIREINGGILTEKNYEFNTVEDSDIIKPDISDCKIQ